MSDQLVVEAATYTTHDTREEHPCPQVDSDPQSQQLSSHRSTSWLQGYWDWLLFSLNIGNFCWNHLQIRWPSWTGDR